MTSDGHLVVFLDANVLAKAVTRTLILRCQAAGYTATWSQTAERQAEAHQTSGHLLVSKLRERIQLALAPTGDRPERYAETDSDDRQILADAEAAEATFLVTEDVDDFGYADLRATGISAVNPDLFLAERVDAETYRQALEVMVEGMTNPSRTPAQLHSAIARLHPRLFNMHSSLYNIPPMTREQAEPIEVYRGRTCVRCLARLDDETQLVDGLGPECRHIEG